MNNCLKIGNRRFDSDQIIAALVQYNLLKTLVGQVLLDEVLKEITLSKQELFHTLIGSADIPIPEDFENFLNQWCQHRDITIDYFNTVLLRNLRLEKFKQLYFEHRIESEFLQTKSAFDQVEYSLVQVNEFSLAQELYFLLRDDKVSFTHIARQYSLGSENRTGGWMGPVPLSTLPSAIATLFRNGQAGEIYGPVAVAERFWIVRLDQISMARLTETTRTHLINRLFDRWLETQVQSQIATPGTIAVQTSNYQSV